MNNEIYLGDNLSVMRSNTFNKYHGAFKMIYIDPPYNTLSKKAYNDSFSQSEWEEFMRVRLLACIPLMSKDGVIFISIDDNEYANLKVICDDVFGRKNYIGTFITMQSQRSNSKLINIVHEYIICYAKDKKTVKKFSIKRIDIPEDKNIIDSLYSEVRKIIESEGVSVANKKIRKIVDKYCVENNIDWLKNYANVDENGKIYFPIDLSTPGKPREVDIPSIGLHLDALKTRGWSTDEKFIEVYNEDRMVFRNGRPYRKHYLEESENNVPSILNFYSRMGTKNLKDLGMDGMFDTPKPVEMIKYLIRISTADNDKILDFFAGSGTMAQAVYEVNKEDNRNNSYVLIQISENITEDTESFEKCIEHKVTPNVKDVLLYRIKRYCQMNNINDAYSIFEENIDDDK